MNDKRIPKGFRGFIYIPTNEQETIGLFLRLMEKIKPTWCIKKLHTDFPDGIFFDTEIQQEIRVEFEHRASNFIAHKHDPDGCEYIICWENDLSSAMARKLRQNIISLKEILAGLPEDAVCLGWNQEGSNDEILQMEINKGNRSAFAVNRLINIEIPEVQKRYGGLFVDRNTTRHYVIRWNGRGICGVYPHGRIVSASVDEFIKKFGTSDIRHEASEFRKKLKEQIKGLNVHPGITDEALNQRILATVQAIETVCRHLETLNSHEKS